MTIVPIQEILDGKHEGEKVAIRGWVYRKREGKQTIFLVVRDSSGIIQCTVKEDSPSWNEAKKVTIESSVTLEGITKKDPRAPGGYEISTENYQLLV